MFKLVVEDSFDSAHFLKGYKGKCSNIHGHRWRVIVEVSSEKLIDSGEKRDMIIDFKDLKQIIKHMILDYDHSLIIETGTLRDKTLSSLLEDGFKITQVDFRPTAEMMAQHFYTNLKNRNIPVSKVSVFETPTNCASYE